MSEESVLWSQKGSAFGFNNWHLELVEFMKLLNSVKDKAWWICDTDLKYLEIRIDTRDNAFLLYRDAQRGEEGRQKVCPSRVVAAIEQYKERFRA